jgi:lipoprotein-anchoring transpeptidase ErfK/SrfK
MCRIGPLASLLGALFMVAASMTAADAAVLITVDKLAQEMTVSVDGVPKYHWPVSTGRLGYDTPSGTYHPFRMEPVYFSKEFDDAPMPHAIFFTPRGHAIHGSLDTAQLGWPVSHGCVRISPENATTLYGLVSREGVNHTTVVVRGLGLPRLFGSDNPQSTKRAGLGTRVSNWFGQTFGPAN